MSLLELTRETLSHEPERVEPSTFTLANLVPYVPQLAGTAPIGLIHVDSSTTDFVVLQDGQVQSGRTVRSGTAGLPASGERLARELRQTLLAWRASGGSPLNKLYVTGPGASLQGVLAFFSGHLETETELMPLPKFESVPPSTADLHRYSRAIALALSLGSRPHGFNLRAGPLAFERGYGFLRDKIPMLAGIAAVLALSFGFSTWMKIRSLDAETRALRKTLGDVTVDVLGKRIEDPDEALDRLTLSRSKLVDPMPKLDAFDAMVAISDVVPSKITHDIEEFDFKKGHVTIHGIVPTIPDAQNIANKLATKPCFKNVKIVRTNQVVNQDRQKYVLEFELNCRHKKKHKKHSSSKETP